MDFNDYLKGAKSRERRLSEYTNDVTDRIKKRKGK